MTLLVGLAIRSSVMLAAGLLLSVSLRGHSAALRHRVLAMTLLAAVLVVPFSFLAPQWIVTLPAGLANRAPAGDLPISNPANAVPRGTDAVPVSGPATSDASSTPSQPVGWRWPTILIVLWLAGILVMLGVLIESLVCVRRLAARASRVADPACLEILESLSRAQGVDRAVVISRADSPDLLGTWGLWRPEVLLPRGSGDWTSERLRIVLGHELAHIRRYDWAVQLGAHVIRGALWFNPLAWLVCRRLRLHCEQACDDEVLRAGVEAREYAAHLLELARQCRRPVSTWASAIPMAHPSTLEARITAMLNPLLDRRAPSRLMVATITAALLLVTLPVGAVRARQVAPAPLTGTVYDATGAVMPGVTVTLIDANDTKWTATSAANGRFELPVVGPGKFVLEAKLVGFRTLRQEFQLRARSDWDRSVTLQIGTINETVNISASRSVLPRQPRGDSDSPEIRVGGNIRVPRKERHVAPVYPPAMIAAGLSGVVPLEAVIAVDGTVSSVRVLSAQVHPDFAIAAADAVRQWRFTPTLLNGVPVEVAMTVTLRFDLAE